MRARGTVSGLEANWYGFGYAEAKERAAKLLLERLGEHIVFEERPRTGDSFVVVASLDGYGDE